MKTELQTRYPELKSCMAQIEAAEQILIKSFRTGGKLLVCGNGGSCADSEHIVGELMKGFLLKRPVGDDVRNKLIATCGEVGAEIADKLQGALPAISLPSQTAVLSAFANDVAADLMYAQLVYGYAREGDVFLGISTSGNSKNVVNAATVAKAMGLSVVALAGEMPCALDKLADCVIHVPRRETYQVQELHLPVYHYLCARCEEEFFAKSTT